MRILFCNKYNYPFSGTEVYIFEAMELLRSRGHETALFSMADERGRPTPYDRHFVPHIDFKQPRRWSDNGWFGKNWFDQIRTAASATYSREARRRIRAMIADFRPDVAHVRNIYHHLSPSILWELKAQKVPILYHLNDFKVLCPNYNLVSRGEACERCKGGRFWQVLREKCYPGSGPRAILMAEAYMHKWLGTYRECVDCFLAPSQFVRDKFVEHGWDAARFEVLPHFQRLEPAANLPDDNAPLLYFGRLSPEKGVDDLLHAMRRLPQLRLTIAGDGSERDRLWQLAAQMELRNVEFTGNLSGAELDQAISGSRFTVLPSHAYETLGKTILESYARGRAVIATDWGSRRELVHEGTTGLLYRMANIDELVEAIQFLSSRPELARNMGLAGRELVRERYSPETHYEGLVAVYERVIDSKKRSAEASRRHGTHAMELPPKKKAASVYVGSFDFIPLQLLVHSAKARVAVREAPEFLPSAVRKNRLRIAFIGGRGVGSKYSGIETYYEEVGRRLADAGHQVTAYCRTYFTPPGSKQKGVQTVRLPTVRTKHLETLLHTFFSTLHVLASRCDIVHYQALGPALFSFIPRLAGKKTVVTVQGLDWQRKKWGRLASFVLQLGERAAATLPDHTIVVSRTLQKHFKDRHMAETSYVPNGGVMRRWREPEKILEWGLEPWGYILLLGRFSPEKGCQLLIDAYGKLESKSESDLESRLESKVQLVMAGASSYCDEYSRRLREQADERIKILDWVSGEDLDELLTNAMIFVLPSDIEGLSLALLDAMGAGVCVLASDIPENREAVEDAGFTFRRGDAADLADRLRFLIANPAVRQAAGEAAKRRVREHYQWSNVAAETERVYFEMMGWDLPARATRKPSISVPHLPAIPKVG
ncbi:MAG: glycosyltransferase family 4 protein [Candidatus Sulfotelmatobacter sp.]